MLRYLLDTNIVIYVLKQRPIEVLATFNANATMKPNDLCFKRQSTGELVCPN